MARKAVLHLKKGRTWLLHMGGRKKNRAGRDREASGFESLDPGMR